MCMKYVEISAYFYSAMKWLRNTVELLNIRDKRVETRETQLTDFFFTNRIWMWVLFWQATSDEVFNLIDLDITA